MSKRYSVLEKLPIAEQLGICAMLCNFFNPLKSREFHEALELPIQDKGITPLSIFDFLMWSKKSGVDLWPKQQTIQNLVILLRNAGILTHAGSRNKAPGLSDCYYFSHERSSLAGKGWLFLGQALGASFIGHEVKKVTAFISGENKDGDISAGTGIHVCPGFILTCAHVVQDLKKIETVHVDGVAFTFKSSKHHEQLDIGVIAIEENTPPKLADIGFRKAHVLEEVVIAGYPRIPYSLEPTITLHTGEIIGRTESYSPKTSYELFSALARPGNSGGPVIALDGRIVGMVTRSLERQKEDTDSMAPLPFFAAVPADILQNVFQELTGGHSLPWEDYN